MTMEIDSLIDDLRQRGNHAFTQRNYDTAVELYTQAIQAIQHEQSNQQEASNSVTDSAETGTSASRTLSPALQLNLCNRSACYYQMEDYEQARQDAELAFSISNKNNLKAAYRLCKALTQLKQYDTAKETIQLALAKIDEMELQERTATGNDKGNEADEKINKTEAVEKFSIQKKNFQDLWNQILSIHYGNRVQQTATEHSIKFVTRGISIKEFDRDKVSLGFGNFSEIVAVTHKITMERFALKIIEKKQAADLAKRQHPNVFNEIQMERRVLLERLSPHPFIVRMYHAFQDYNNLYYLMDLHTSWSDLWSELRYKTTSLSSTSSSLTSQKEQSFMVGCHRSQARIWMYQLIDALEHLHKHGIVHRDLKPENILLNGKGHIIVIDFGTAKDLIETDLNGPEFVGTPDFMSPEAVQDGKLMILGTEDSKDNDLVAVHTADLFTFGGIIYSLHTGMTPFWSPSPYLTFLRIKRCNLLRSAGIVDDDTWDLIQNLMQLDPRKRIGAGSFSLRDGVPRRILQFPEDGSARPYDCLRNHPYFTACRQEEERVIFQETPVPTLEDLCIRPIAELVYQDSLDIELCDKHPPGDGSSHDMMRLQPRSRACVMHVLDRMKLLRDSRLYARFFDDPVQARLDKVRPAMRDYVGLTRMNDDQGKPPKATMNDPYAKPIAVPDIEISLISNPLFVESLNKSCTDDIRKLWIKQLKRCISTINRSRPRLVVANGYIDSKCRKLLARISESIPVVIHDGSAFFSFWLTGVQCIAIQQSQVNETTKEGSDQVVWLREQLEQVRLSKHPLFVFCNGNPQELSSVLLKRLARGRTLALYGVSAENDHLSFKVSYQANERVDDTVSIQSNESDEDDDRDSFTMKVKATHENGLRTIVVDEEPDKWMDRFQALEVESNAMME